MKTFRQIIAKTALPYGRFFVVFLLLSAGVALFDVMVTRATGDLSNAAVALNTGALKGILLTMAWLTGVKLVCVGLVVYLNKLMYGHAETRLRGGFARHFSFISFKDLNARPSGDILALYTNDLPSSAAFLTGSLLDVLSDALMLMAAAVFMFRIHWLYALIFFLSFPLLTLMQVGISKPLAPLMAERSRLRGVFNGVVNDCLQNTSLILGYGLEDAMEKRYLKAYDAFYAVEKRRMAATMKLIIGGIVASFAPIIFLTLASALAVVQGTLSLGEFIALFILALSANQGLTMLSQNIGQIREQKVSSERMLDALKEPHEVLGGAGVSSGGAGDTALMLKDVSFSYDGETPVLKNVSLSIPRGARVAFVGKSGCGKSTLAKLMLGLYAPDEGSIRWLDSDKITVESARRSVAYVPQDSFLFPGTVAENLRCGAAIEEGDASRLLEALSAAELGAFIEGRAGGLESVIEENGENLSGGQKQRLAVARALFRGAPILLLDEATSALDPSTERAVLTRLNETAKEQTIVMVAHRLAAVEACDTVYVMDCGEIVEKGGYEGLMRPGTRFYALYMQQKEEEDQHA